MIEYVIVRLSDVDGHYLDYPYGRRSSTTRPSQRARHLPGDASCEIGSSRSPRTTTSRSCASSNLAGYASYTTLAASTRTRLLIACFRGSGSRRQMRNAANARPRGPKGRKRPRPNSNIS